MQKLRWFTLIFFSAVTIGYSQQVVFTKQQLNQAVNVNKVDTALFNYALFVATNNYRSKKGRGVLAENQVLENMAQLHTKQMRKYKFFSHFNNRNKQYRTLKQRATHFGFSGDYVGENLLKGYLDLQNPPTYMELANWSVKELSKSKTHNQQMLDNRFSHLGCFVAFEKPTKKSYVYFYFTQNFGRF